MKYTINLKDILYSYWEYPTLRIYMFMIPPVITIIAVISLGDLVFAIAGIVIGSLMVLARVLGTYFRHRNSEFELKLNENSLVVCSDSLSKEIGHNNITKFIDGNHNFYFWLNDLGPLKPIFIPKNKLDKEVREKILSRFK